MNRDGFSGFGRLRRTSLPDGQSIPADERCGDGFRFDRRLLLPAEFPFHPGAPAFRFANSRNHFRRFQGRSAWRVKFLIMVLFNDFNIGKIVGSHLRKLHHQHGSEREVWRDDSSDSLLIGQFHKLVQVALRKSCRSHNRTDAVLQRDFVCSLPISGVVKSIRTSGDVSEKHSVMSV